MKTLQHYNNFKIDDGHDFITHSDYIIEKMIVSVKTLMYDLYE